MEKITSKQFEKAVRIDPAWASKLTKPVEITNYCDMTETKITHLSNLLHFTGKNDHGDSASFTQCESLEVAEGNFKGCVDFTGAGIKKIGNLTCGKNNGGNSAYFHSCRSLKIAEGNFPGCIGFADAGVERIGNLTCGKNISGISAYFFSCQNLKVARGNFPGSVGFHSSNIERIEDLTCGKNDRGIRLEVALCHNLKRIPTSFNPHEVEADEELLKELKADRLKEAAKKHLQTKILEI